MNQWSKLISILILQFEKKKILAYLNYSRVSGVVCFLRGEGILFPLVGQGYYLLMYFNRKLPQVTRLCSSNLFALAFQVAWTVVLLACTIFLQQGEM
jgi:hypothetical protein